MTKRGHPEHDTKMSPMRKRAIHWCKKDRLASVECNKIHPINLPKKDQAFKTWSENPKIKILFIV